MRVMFVCQRLMTFVRRDVEILQSAHEVRVLQFRGFGDIPAVFAGTHWADLTFSWFGKLHAFSAVLFSKLLGKRSVVVAGGDDVACVPEIRYGMFAYWWKKWCPLFVFRYADLILAVSKLNRQETIKNAKASPAKVKLLYHGFNADALRVTHNGRREQLAITVGGVDRERLHRKGYDLFVRSAEFLPRVQFVLVGQWHDGAVNHLRAVAHSNVHFTGRVSDGELLKWFSRSKAYVQPSLHEGFGCSVAEAMLCECVPVVSRRGALPEVVGDAGLYVDELTPEAVATQIKLAMNSGLGRQARERIVREFPLEKRRRGLLKAVDKVMAN